MEPCLRLIHIFDGFFWIFFCIFFKIDCFFFDFFLEPCLRVWSIFSIPNQFFGCFKKIEIKLNSLKQGSKKKSILVPKKIEENLILEWISYYRAPKKNQFLNFLDFWDPWGRFFFQVPYLWIPDLQIWRLGIWRSGIWRSGDLIP